MKRIRFIIYAVVLLSSCSSLDNKYQVRNSKVEEYYLPHYVNEVLEGYYDCYLDYFQKTDYQIGLSSKKEGSLSGGRIISCYSGKSEVSRDDYSKVCNVDFPDIKSYVNGVELCRDNLVGPSVSKSDLNSNNLQSVFGTNARFTINSPGTKSIGDVITTEMYIPKEMIIEFPPIEKIEDVAPLVYYKDFNIRWNVDLKNSNGVICFIEWDGEMLLGSDLQDTSVRRVAIFPDTGSAILPE